MAGRKWAKQEDEFIISNYKNMTVDELADELNRTRSGTDSRMRSLGIKRAKEKIPNLWTDEQIRILTENYKTCSRRKLAILTNQSENNVRTKLIELGLVDSDNRKQYKVKESKRFYDWTEERIQYLKDNFTTTPMKIMCEYLQCSGHTILRKGKVLGLPSIRRQTMPERIVENILKELNINYEKEVYIPKEKFRCDFIIGDIVIEVQGDYWHANPKIYSGKTLDKTQKYNVAKDIRKKKALENLGYEVIYIWEYDINNNYQECFNKIKLCLLNKKTP